jgi:Na+-transporting NADH:ubiquinone oxidoreductase subunit NqrA
MPNLDTTEKEEHHPVDNVREAKEKFNRHLISENALATNNVTAEKFDMDKAKQKSSDALIAIGADGGLQSMLAAQMFSIHKLQQKSMIYANVTDNFDLQKYYTNSAVKLANCFVQQANILAKLQGIGGQKIIVERVDVHQGGQAIVGNIQGGMGNKEKT